MLLLDMMMKIVWFSLLMFFRCWCSWFSFLLVVFSMLVNMVIFLVCVWCLLGFSLF